LVGAPNDPEAGIPVQLIALELRFDPDTRSA
jgi:hypothetical protein